MLRIPGRRLLFAFIRLTLASLTFAAPIEADRSVVVITDHSFSMSVRHAAAARAPALLVPGALREMAAESAVPTEWAFVRFDDVGSIELRVPFTRSIDRVIGAATETEVWARTPLAEAVDFAVEYLLSEAAGEERIIILLSDCIPTDPVPLALPDLSRLVDGNLVLAVLSPGIPENGILESRIAEWVRSAGGGYYRFGEEDLLIDEIFGTERPAEVPEAADPADDPEEMTRPVEHEGDTGIPPPRTGNPPRTFGVRLSLLLIVPFAVFAAVFALSLRTYLRRRGAVNTKIVRTTPVLEVTILRPDGESEAVRLDRFPVRIGADLGSDIVLENPKIRSKHAREGFVIEYDGADAYFTSRLRTLVSGVACRNKKLREGDVIQYGPFRILFTGAYQRTEEPEKFPAPYFMWQAAAALIFIVLAGLLWDPLFVTFERPVRPDSVTDPVPADPSPAIEPDRAPAVRGNGHEVMVLGPGEVPEDDKGKADVLFIHAHPDDESLDFGSLIAGSAVRGLRIAVVLFTDGGGGIDQYPRRIVGGPYPEFDLSGNALSAVRTAEAARAMSILGVETYLRLDLPNNPYNGIADALSLSGVLGRWGGRSAVVNRMAELIRRFAPSVVVSPDAASGAHEHFEHEAVGTVVAEALERLAADGFTPDHLVSVDPLQREAYGGLFAFDAMAPLPGTGEPSRSLQVRALSEYHTQRDAQVIGAEVLPLFGSEYYFVKRWEAGTTPESYFSGR